MGLKGQQTRQRIIQEAAQIFSIQGYAGASISDLMRETGMQKGGIYNHFKHGKDELALAAFDYSVNLVRERIAAALDGNRHALDRLLALIEVFRSLIDDPVVVGGCPLLNTAIEADDTHPALRQRAQSVMTEWRDTITHIVRKGIERDELRPDVDPDALATIFIASLEGAVMMSKLYGDSLHMTYMADYLGGYVRLLAQPQ